MVLGLHSLADWLVGTILNELYFVLVLRFGWPIAKPNEQKFLLSPLRIGSVDVSVKNGAHKYPEAATRSVCTRVIEGSSLIVFAVRRRAK